MKTLIEIQALINRIEDLTLEVKYHSTFKYPDEKNLMITTYYWGQAAAYKAILEKSKLDVIIDIKNNKLKIYSYFTKEEAE